jgi:glutathione S-transferase
VPEAFIKDREALSGRPFDVNAMKAAAPALSGQWRAQATWIEDQLVLAPWLSGAAPGLADIAAYMNLWFLGGSLPALLARFTEGLPRLQDWKARVTAIGHGVGTDLSGPEALAIAKTAEPAPAPPHDAANPQMLTPGQGVTVMADDYGRDPVRGALVAAALDRTVIARDDPAVGRVHVHFPKTGYLVFAG